ncbi:MAG TPA: CHAT domain-containing tetratricopeptide repeat protein [Planctomycetota bacterium]|jgi:CHAT domain-containing protein/tetratricopeptide (TPR) repeat protein|nr:CHAT domain-containing tetratricopeptide repeat protein [Planctomycetota bacterium]
MLLLVALLVAATLAERRSPASTLDPEERVRPGEPVAGSLSGREEALPGHGPAKRFAFVPDAGGAFTVSLESLDFDALLRVERESGEVLAEDDNGGIETNARVLFDAAAGARYRIVAAAASEKGGSGDFRLALVSGEAPLPGGGERLDAAISYQAQAAERSLARRDRAASLLHRLAEADRRFARSQFKEAKGAYGTALDLARGLGDASAQSRALGGLGIAHRSLGEYAEARQRLEEYLSLARGRKESREEVWALGSLGNVEYSLGNLPAARERYEGQLGLARALGDRAEEARALGNLGGVAEAVGDPSQAREHYEGALEIYRTLGDRVGEGRICGNLGGIHALLGELPQARTLHERHLALARESGDRAEESKALGDLGLVLEGSGDVEAARTHHEKRLALVRELGDRAGEGAALGSLADLELSLGRLERARALYERRRAIAQEIGDRADEARALGGLGGVAFELGDYAEARSHQGRRLALAQELGLAGEETGALTDLGILCTRLGDHARARLLHERCLADCKKRGDPVGEANAWTNVGAARSATGDHAGGRACFERALEIFRRVGDLGGEAAASTDLGDELAFLGESSAAADLHRRALDLFGKIGARQGEAGAITRLATLALATGEPEEARRLAEDARRRWKELGSEENLLLPLAVLLQVALSESDPAGAAPAIEEAARILDRAALGRLSIPERSGLRASNASWSELLQDWAALRAARAATPEERLRAWTDGLRNAGRWKGRALLEGISEHRGGGRTAEAIALRREIRETLAERGALLERIARAVAEGEPSQAVEARRAEASSLLGRVAEAERALGRLSPRDASLDRPPEADLPSLRAELPERAALLEYAEGTRRLYAYVVTRERFALVDLGEREEVRKAVERFEEAVRRPSGPASRGEVVEAGRRAFLRLLAPVLAEAGEGIERLAIVPSATLAALPFEALVSGPPGAGAPSSFSEVEFVLDRLAVSYAPSSPVLAELSLLGPRRAAGRALVLADPLYASESAEPESRAGQGLETLLGEVRAGPDPSTLQRLEKTRTEALALARLLLQPDEGEAAAALSELSRNRSGSLAARRFDLHLGAEASKARLRGDLRPYSILHVGAHGWVDPEDPLRTGIGLAAAAGGAGTLAVADVLELDLDANLVVLSACETARGAERPGEGIESLARAFLYAGSRAVVASLWQVADWAAAQTMEAFYRELDRPRSPADALREAKLALRRSTGVRGVLGLAEAGGGPAIEPGHPYFWAPFIHVGRPR